MINRDWERFGEDIRRTVQNAIDSKDFGKLNQTITNTINDAVDSIADNIRNAQNGQSRQAAHPYREESPKRRPNQEHPYQAHPYQAEPNQAYPYQARPYQGRKLPKLFRMTAFVNMEGMLMTVIGAVLGGAGLILFIPMLLASLTGVCGIAEIIMMAFFLVLSVGGFTLCGCGKGICGRVRRFKAYIQILGQREYCNIRELADKSKKSVKYVIRDLEYMLSKKWFLEGHMDRQKTCLIVSHGMYQQYLSIEAGRAESGSGERKRESKVSEGESGNRAEEEEPKTEKQPKLPPEVQKVVDEGDAYILKIHACNDAIMSGEMSAKISRMEMLIDKIFDRVEQDPESIDDIRRMMEYYLPTTVKLLEAYRELDSQPVDGENIRSSKREIEATLDTLNVAFEKLLDGMFQETAWDVSSDISVLHTMLAQEGLTDDGLWRTRQDEQ